MVPNRQQVRRRPIDILADGGTTDKAAQDTFIVKMQSNLSIISYQADEEPAVLAMNGRQYN